MTHEAPQSSAVKMLREISILNLLQQEALVLSQCVISMVMIIYARPLRDKTLFRVNSR